MATLILFLTSFVIFYAMRCYKIYNFRKHELLLYEVKDRLNKYADEGKIDRNDWLYKFLDTSIFKSISSFSHLNLWYAIYLRKNHKNDANLIWLEHHLEHALLKNKLLNEVFNEYQLILWEYIVSRHIVLLFLTKTGIDYTTESIRFCDRLLQSMKKTFNSLIFLPEITTSYDFGKPKKHQVVPSSVSHG